MSDSLKVHLYGRQIGVLSEDALGHLEFRYGEIINEKARNKRALQDIRTLIIYQKLLIKLLMILLMKLLIKPKWRGVFQMYLIDFKQKEGSLTYYPFLSAIKKAP